MTAVSTRWGDRLTSRRVVLSLPVLAAVAACGPGVEKRAEAAVSGSVTNPTGSVGGTSLTGLVDAYTGNYGGSAQTTPPQWQHAVLLSATTGACGREGSGGSYAAGEVTLRFTLVGYWNTAGQLPPVYPPTPVAFTADGTWLTTSDGVQRQLKAYVMKARSNGNPGSDVAATSGTVTVSRADSAQYEGSYDLHFGTDHVTGSFVAPWCGTAP